MLWNCGVGEDSWESPGLKEIKPVHPKGNQSLIFIGRTDAEAESPILWPSDAQNWLLRKDPDAGKDWREEEKGTTEDEMIGWHHWLDGHEFEQALGDGEGQGNLACCHSWCHNERDMTEWLNNNNTHTHTYIKDYYSAIKSDLLPLAVTWMDLEGIMLSEISQTK